jgi:hypothetical protein
VSRGGGGVLGCWCVRLHHASLDDSLVVLLLLLLLLLGCRRFWECLYTSLAAVLAEAFERVGGKQPAIEAELGRLFR